MTKSELKTGMIVVLANGKEYMVFKNAHMSVRATKDCLVATDRTASWFTLNSYNEDLTFKCEYRDHDGEKYNIVEVVEVFHPYSFIDPNMYKDKRTTIWRRKEKKKYTYAQLREILGEEFEVIG